MSAARGRPGWRLGALVPAWAAVATALVLSGGAPRPAPVGLPDAGVASGWAYPLLRTTYDVCAVLVVGALLTAAALLPLDRGRLAGTGALAVRAAGRAAWAWAAAAGGLYVAATSQAVGRPITELLVEPGLLGYGLALPEGRALAAAVVVCVGIGLNAARARTRAGAAGLLLIAMGATLPLLLSGHAASAGDHYLLAQALIVHVWALTAWTGALVGVVWLARHDAALVVVARRLSLLAMGCFVAVAVSGTVLASLQLGGDVVALGTPYGGLLLTKSVLLAVVGVLGWLHRRRTLPALEQERPGAFARLATVEVLVLAVAVGVAAALGRTPLPPSAPAGGGHGAEGADLQTLPAIGVVPLLSQWRPDAVTITVLALVAGGYVAGAARLRRSGIRWPWSRSVVFLSGLLLALVLLCSGVAVYASALLCVQAAQVLTLALTVPVLLTWGRPLQLLRLLSGAQESRPPAAWSRTTSDPVNGLAALLALLTVLYTTPLLGLGLESPSVERVVGVAALGGGFLFIWPVLAVDWTPAARPVRDRFVLALFACGLLVVVSALVMRSGAALERRWFEDLHLVWADAATDRGWTLGVVAVHATMLLGLAGWLGLAARDQQIRPARPGAAPGGRRSPRGIAAARR